MRNPNAAFCCNFCGSGRFQVDQLHHPSCEFYVKPQRHVSLPGRKTPLPPVPPEDPAEGCPGGYYRSLFVASVAPYLRRRDGQGNRVANPLLDRTDDEVLLQLVDRAAQTALDQFAAQKLLPTQFALTLVDLSSPASSAPPLATVTLMSTTKLALSLTGNPAPGRPRLAFVQAPDASSS